MEGITGVTHWDEVDHDKPAYGQFQKQMSLEVFPNIDNKDFILRSAN